VWAKVRSSLQAAQGRDQPNEDFGMAGMELLKCFDCFSFYNSTLPKEIRIRDSCADLPISPDTNSIVGYKEVRIDDDNQCTAFWVVLPFFSIPPHSKHLSHQD
jgi:hypothetical protein